MKKIPSKWAMRLAVLHNLVMELQDEFETHKNDCYSNDFEDWEIEDVEDFNVDRLGEEVESILYRLEDLEAETSELDCEYNDYN